MKTKIIPFDIDLARKIQAGEIEGKIKTKDDKNVRIICLDRVDSYAGPIIALYTTNKGIELPLYCNVNGKDAYTDKYIVLEVPDNELQEQQFKPFDKVLVRNNDASLWRTGFYSHELDGKHCVCGNYYPQCIPYAGNEHLVGTTDKPKELC